MRNTCFVLFVMVGAAVENATPPACLAQSSAPVARAAANLDPVVDRILTRQEDRKVRDLRAKLVWDLHYIIEDTTERKFGRILFRDAEPAPKFKVLVDSVVRGNRREKSDDQYMFDGFWYVELKSGPKTVTRREIRKPGDKSNPYRLGQGAFPLPFGQTKADILADFDVTRLPEPPVEGPADTDCLKLVPRPGSSMESQYTEIEMWIADGGENSGLPVQVRAGKRGGDGELNHYITIRFSDIELNTGLADSALTLETPRGYEEQIEPIGAGDDKKSAPRSKRG